MRDDNASSVWFDQASKLLIEAQSSFRTERHAWTCILAQQSAEKALIALYAAWLREPWGCSVSQLLRGLAPDLTIPEDLVEKGRALDSCLARGGTNGNGPGARAARWGPEQSETAIGCAMDMAEFVRNCFDCRLVDGEGCCPPQAEAPEYNHR